MKAINLVFQNKNFKLKKKIKAEFIITYIFKIKNVIKCYNRFILLYNKYFFLNF